MFDNSPEKHKGITIGTGIKLGIGISIGILIVLCGILLIGALVFRHVVTPSTDPDKTSEAPEAKQIKPSDEDWEAKFAALSTEEKLRKRLAGVEGANKNATGGCVVTLTGQNQDIFTIKCPPRYNQKEDARLFATSVIDAFFRDGKTVKEMIALDYKSLVVTDGKNTWTRDLQTGTLTEQEVK